MLRLLFLLQSNYNYSTVILRFTKILKTTKQGLFFHKNRLLVIQLEMQIVLSKFIIYLIKCAVLLIFLYYLIK